jgi:hypothetical protein
MSPSEMVASVIAQLIRTGIDKERLMRILKLQVQFNSYFTNQANELRNFDTLCTTLLEMVQGFPIPVIVLLDALDECTDPSGIIRHLLEPSLKPDSIADAMMLPTIGGNIPIRFILTGRPNVHNIFASLSYMSTIGMDVNEDIRKFVKEKVADDERLRRHEDHIMATILMNSQGMFHYAGKHHQIQFKPIVLNQQSALVLEELNEPSPDPIVDRLKAIPQGITGMYERILRRIISMGTDSEHKMRRRLLVWVTLGNRPIKLAEMQYACVTREGQKPFDPDVVVLPTVKQMLASCGPLLEVYDKNRLRFTHRTVKEFLLQPLDRLSEESRKDKRMASCMVNEAEGHAWMAITCGEIPL